MKFNFLNTFFQRQMKHGSGSMRYSYYLVPAFVAFSVALINYGSTAFGVYLKYQALVDTYYERNLKFEEY